MKESSQIVHMPAIAEVTGQQKLLDTHIKHAVSVCTTFLPQTLHGVTIDTMGQVSNKRDPGGIRKWDISQQTTVPPHLAGWMGTYFSLFGSAFLVGIESRMTATTAFTVCGFHAHGLLYNNQVSCRHSRSTSANARTGAVIGGMQVSV